MPLPPTFLDHLQREGYDPRSNKHSNILAMAIVNDLVENCDNLRNKASSGEVVFDLNRNVHVQTTDWNIDLVIGRPARRSPPEVGLIRREAPATIQVAVEIKAVMTEHRKNVKNRKRDLEAHHQHAYNYNSSTISAGVLVVNAAPRFRSPHRKDGPTIHRASMGPLVEYCLNELRNVAERSDPSGRGLDAKCGIVLDMDNIEPATTRFVERAPAPQLGDPLNYDSFVQRLCDFYSRRFG